MQFFGFLFGILLPWMLGGWVLSRLSRVSHADFSPHPALTLGHAWLIGLPLVLPLLLLAEGMGPWFGRSVILLGSSLVLLRLLHWLRSSEAGLGLRIASLWMAMGERLAGPSPLILLLTVLLALHLLGALQQLLSSSVFGWDAWSTWAYRGKVWMLNGYQAFIGNELVQGQDPEARALAAHAYPPLVSLFYWWAASTAGGWREEWFGLYWWLLQWAMLLSLYGHGRVAGLTRGRALLVPTLLVSLPMFQVQVALYGYADLWQAGYSGLGLAALLHGLVVRRPGLVVIGLVLCLIGLGVKQEGLLWLILALGLLLSGLPMRLLVMGLALGLLLAGGLLIGGPFELPGLGCWGLGEQDVIWLGPMGPQQLAMAPALRELLAAMFGQGNWHLYWLLVLGIPLLVARARVARRLPLLLLVLLYLGLLAFTFLFSEHGRWLAEYTAFNRVAMQPAPALLLGLIFLRGLRRRVTPSAWLKGLVLLLTMLLVVVMGRALWFLQLYPDQGDNRPLTLSTERLHFERGSGRLFADGIRFDRLDGDEALVVSPPTLIDASRYGFIHLDGTAHPLAQSRLRFYWQRLGDERRLHSIALPLQGEHWIPLHVHPQWKGQIERFGIGVQGDVPLELRWSRLRLESVHLSSVVKSMLTDWLATEPRRWQSVNLPAGMGEGLLPLSTAVLFALMLALWLARYLRKRWRLPRSIPLLLIAWLLLDLSWLNTLGGWVAQSQRDGSGLGLADHRLREELAQVEARLSGESTRVLFVHAGQDREYLWLRSRYLLARHHMMRLGDPRSDLAARATYLLATGAAANKPPPPNGWRLADGRRLVATLIHAGDRVALYRLGDKLLPPIGAVAPPSAELPPPLCR